MQICNTAIVYFEDILLYHEKENGVLLLWAIITDCGAGLVFLSNTMDKPVWYAMQDSYKLVTYEFQEKGT